MGSARDVVDRVWDAMESGDVERLSGLIADDVEYAMAGQHARGLHEFMPFVTDYMTAFPDLRHEVLDAVEVGDTIALELHVTGTHTGPLQTPKGEIQRPVARCSGNPSTTSRCATARSRLGTCTPTQSRS